MSDYSKWDKLAKEVDDSDQEPEGRPGPARMMADELEKYRREQEYVDHWLKRQVATLELSETTQRGGPPELTQRSPTRPFRKVTAEERKILAMLVVVSHFEEGRTNLDRHPVLLDLVRHNRWLEEDPGALELLCRVQHLDKQGIGGGEMSAPSPGEAPSDARIRYMCLAAINTLAAPKKAACAGGLLELITAICTPSGEREKELRKKWEKKEFAKDALFESLFPELKPFGENEDAGGWSDLALIGATLLFVVLAVVALIYLLSVPAKSGPSAATAASSALSAAASTASAAASAASADLAASKTEL